MPCAMFGFLGLGPAEAVSLCFFGFLALLVVTVLPWWLYCLIDHVRNEKDEGQRTTWVLILVLVPPLVSAPLYWFVRRPARLRAERNIRAWEEATGGGPVPPPLFPREGTR